MKRITTLILTSIALLTMTSSVMAEEVMDYNPLTPTFEFEIKVGDNSKMALATQLEYKTSSGNIVYRDVDCTLDKGFFSKTIDCSGLPLIDIYANDLQISNGYGKFKVRVGDITNFNLPAGSHPLRLMARASTSPSYIKKFTIVDGMPVCTESSEDRTICENACQGIGVAKPVAKYHTTFLYTTADGLYDVSRLECQVTCFCRPFSPKDEEVSFPINYSTPSCK